jgi:hypothetical protein
MCLERVGIHICLRDQPHCVGIDAVYRGCALYCCSTLAVRTNLLLPGLHDPIQLCGGLVEQRLVFILLSL